MLASTYTATWYEVQDEDGYKIRRFSTMEEAQNYAMYTWTVEKIVLTRQLFVPEEAPF